MDFARAGKVLQEQLAEIEEEYGDGDRHEIGAVITIVQVESADGQMALRLRHNLDGQPVRLIGFLELAKQSALTPFSSESP